MLRGAGLAMTFLVAIAAPAQANGSGRAADDSLVRSGATAAMSAAAAEQVTRVLSAGQPPRTAKPLAGFRREAVNQAAGPVSLAPQRRQRQPSTAFPWLSHGRSGVALPLTDRLFVGLGYRHMEGEDLWPEFADTGAVDYDSHHILVRAHWRF